MFVSILKETLNKYNIISNFSQKKVGIFFIIRSVGMGIDYMLSFTF